MRLLTPGQNLLALGTGPGTVCLSPRWLAPNGAGGAAPAHPSSPTEAGAVSEPGGLALLLKGGARRGSARAPIKRNSVLPLGPLGMLTNLNHATA